MRAPPSLHQGLWTLAFAPTVWAAHFLSCYISAALVCQNLARGLDFDGLRIAILCYTLLAWLLIGWHAVICVQHLRRMPDDDLSEASNARRRFLAGSGLLLALLSLVAVALGAVPALFFGDCS